MAIKIKTKRIIYLTLALISATVLIILRKQPWEYLTLFTTGLFIGNSFEKRQKAILVVSIILYLVAITFDQLLKPLLDTTFKVSTVAISSISIKVNTILFLLFWLGFYLGKQNK